MIDERRLHDDIAATYAKGRHAGALAASAWLSARGLSVASHLHWEVSIAMDVIDEQPSARFTDTLDTRFHVAIASTEWGFYFCHHSRVSWIRVTDLPFINERDDYMLLPQVPPLRDLGRLIQTLEGKYRIRFRREHAAIRATIPDAEAAIRSWVVSSI